MIDAAVAERRAVPIGETIARLVERQGDVEGQAIAIALAAAMLELLGAGLTRACSLGGPAIARAIAGDPLVGGMVRTTADEIEFDAAFERIEQLLGDAERLAEPGPLRALTAELIGLVGDALLRIHELGGRDLAHVLADDDRVGSLLVLAGIHRDPPELRARAALAEAAAELASAGVVVDTVLADGPHLLVKLALDVPAGRPAATVSIDDGRVRGLVELIVMARAPDVDQIFVEIAGRVAMTPDFVPRDRLMRRRTAEHSVCDLCALPLAERHDHVYAPTTRTLKCACLGCATIVPSTESSPYRRVPRDVVRLAVADVTRWLDRLGVPVGIAALVRHDDDTVTLAYPGPAGLVDAPVDAAVWSQMCDEILGVATLVPEVEALVWSRLGEGPSVTRVGIDGVFRIVGEIRKNWRGITGGDGGPAAIARVLAELHAEAR